MNILFAVGNQSIFITAKRSPPMQSNFSFLFYLKKPKGYVSGPAPIYLRITVDGLRAEMSVGRECPPEKWNSQAGIASGSKEDTKALNAYLNILQGKIHQNHALLLAAGEPVTAEVLKNKVSGKTERGRSLVKIFQDHNNKIEA
ncbi:MAG: Arm DNA-binding domain-containing protein, partial [Cytophaga sp.]